MWMQRCLVLVLMTSTFGVSAAAQPRIGYRVTRVAPLISDGQAINKAGATVGSYQFSGSGAHAFLSRGNDALDLGALDSFTNNSLANDIDGKFQVVGTSDTGTGQRGFIHDRGVMRDVRVYLPANTTATGINGAGYVVGAYPFNGAPPRGYLRAPEHRQWHRQARAQRRTSDHLDPFVYRGRKMESLHALVDPAGRYIIRDVQGINDKGQIVGRADQEGVAFGFAVRLDPIHRPAHGMTAAEEQAEPQEE